MINRSRSVFALLISVIWAYGAGTAGAQDFPAKPVTYVVADAPGTTGDIVARILAPEMSKVLGKPVIVSNKPGAGNRIGFEYVAKGAPADGYTFVAVTVETLALLPVTVKTLPFDALKDIPPLINLGDGRLVFGTSPKSSWKTFEELIAHAKANPGKLNYGASTSIVRFPMEALIGALGINVIYIPYATSASYTTQLVAGEVHMGLIGELPARALGPNLRVLAVTGEQRRAPYLDVPTFVELGHPQIPDVNYSLNVRAGTPKAAADKLYAAAAQALKQPETVAALEKIGFHINEKSSADSASMLAQRAKLFAEIANRVGIQPE